MVRNNAQVGCTWHLNDAQLSLRCAEGVVKSLASSAYISYPFECLCFSFIKSIIKYIHYYLIIYRHIHLFFELLLVK